MPIIDFKTNLNSANIAEKIFPHLQQILTFSSPKTPDLENEFDPSPAQLVSDNFFKLKFGGGEYCVKLENDNENFVIEVVSLGNFAPFNSEEGEEINLSFEVRKKIALALQQLIGCDDVKEGKLTVKCADLAQKYDLAIIRVKNFVAELEKDPKKADEFAQKIFAIATNLDYHINQNLENQNSDFKQQILALRNQNKSVYDYDCYAGKSDEDAGYQSNDLKKNPNFQPNKRVKIENSPFWLSIDVVTGEFALRIDETQMNILDFAKPFIPRIAAVLRKNKLFSTILDESARGSNPDSRAKVDIPYYENHNGLYFCQKAFKELKKTKEQGRELPSFKTQEGQIHNCLMINQNYELWRDNNRNLDYIRLKNGGIKNSFNLYIKKYPQYIKRDETEFSCHQRKINSENFYTAQEEKAVILEQAAEIFRSEIARNQDKKQIFLTIEFVNNSGFQMHAVPFALVKDDDGEYILVDFENRFQFCEIAGIKNIVRTQNYSSRQSDWHSCSIFSVDTIKNCAIDPKFRTSVVDAAENNQALVLNNMLLGQRKAQIQNLPSDKKNRYVEADYNYKALYKGHQYAASNPQNLSDYTQTKIQNINNSRQFYNDNPYEIEIANKKLYKPHTSLNALTAISSQSKNIWYLESRLNQENARANNFKVKQGIYADYQDVCKTMVSILIMAAQKVGMSQAEIKQAIKIAKEQGGIAHSLNDDYKTYRQNDIKKSDQLYKAKIFSAYFQKFCENCGIYSGRDGSNKGLRLTFLPDKALEIFAQNSIENAAEIVAQKTGLASAGLASANLRQN